MQVKTILNRIQEHRGFVYGEVRLEDQFDGLTLTVDLYPHARNRPQMRRLWAPGAPVRPPGNPSLRVRAALGPARLLPVHDAALVEIELRDRASETTLADRNDSIETFFFDRSHEALCVRIRVWGPHGRQHHVNARVAQQPSHFPTPMVKKYYSGGRVSYVIC